MILGYCVVTTFQNSDGSISTSAAPLQTSKDSAIAQGEHLRKRLNCHWRVFVACVELKNEQEIKL